VVVGKNELRGSNRERALAGFARLLTEVPWAVDAEDVARLRKENISDAAIEHSILVTAFFNYFPRVADGTGVEFDYDSPLPRIDVDKTREALPRIAVEDWNSSVNGATLPKFVHVPFVEAKLAPWRALHLERDAPLGTATRAVIARAAAAELCDHAAVDHWKDVKPRHDLDEHLADFARKLTKTPWAMDAGDVDRLRAQGLSDEAILGAVTLVAYQNAISRMHHGLAAMRTRHRGDGERT